jgi:hypothetical protein
LHLLSCLLAPRLEESVTRSPVHAVTMSSRSCWLGGRGRSTTTGTSRATSFASLTRCFQSCCFAQATTPGCHLATGPHSPLTKGSALTKSWGGVCVSETRIRCSFGAGSIPTIWDLRTVPCLRAPDEGGTPQDRPLGFCRPFRLWMPCTERVPNQMVQRTGASRFALTPIHRQGRLAPVADLCVSP